MHTERLYNNINKPPHNLGKTASVTQEEWMGILKEGIKRVSEHWRLMPINPELLKPTDLIWTVNVTHERF